MSAKAPSFSAIPVHRTRKHAGADARYVRRSRQRNDRHSHPKRLAGRRYTVVREYVQSDVDSAVRRQMTRKGFLGPGKLEPFRTDTKARELLPYRAARALG